MNIYVLSTVCMIIFYPFFENLALIHVFCLAADSEKHSGHLWKSRNVELHGLQ